MDLPQHLASRHPIIPCRLLDLVPPSSLTATASWIIPAFRLAPNGAWLSPGTAETITATSSKPGTVTGAGEESSADGYMEASRLQEPNVGRVFIAPLGDVHLWSHVSCCCCYLDLRAVQRVRDSAPSPIHSEKRDHRLQATSPERHYCGIFVGAARQTRNGRCRSRPGPRSSDSIGWFCYPAAVWRHAQTTAEVRPLSVWPGRYVGRPSHRHEG